MSEVKSWDTVFFVKALNQNIGIRVYYVVDYEKGEIHYQGHTKEFGLTTITYNNNPKQGDTSTFRYEFKVVVSEPYSKEQDNKKLKCIDIKVDAIQKTEIKNSALCSINTDFLEDDQTHTTTECVDCKN